MFGAGEDLSIVMDKANFVDNVLFEWGTANSGDRVRKSRAIWFLLALDDGATDDLSLDVLAASAPQWGRDPDLGLIRLRRAIELAPSLAWPKIHWCRQVLDLPSTDRDTLRLVLERLAEPSVSEEYGPTVIVLESRCHVELHDFESAERRLCEFDFSGSDESSSDLLVAILINQLALLGQEKFNECLAFTRSLPTQMLGSQSRQIVACCHHALGQLEDTVRALEKIEPADLSRSSRCIYLNALTRLRQFDRLGHVLSGLAKTGP